MAYSNLTDQDRCPKDSHINKKILHHRCKARDKEMSRSHDLQDPQVYMVFGAPIGNNNGKRLSGFQLQPSFLVFPVCFETQKPCL